MGHPRMNVRTMRKLIAVLNVMAWAGFWAFGYLALSGDAAAGDGRIVTAALLAALGGGLGLWAWITLIRLGGERGQARPLRPAPVESEGERV